jgi:hypothetical protein
MGLSWSSGPPGRSAQAPSIRCQRSAVNEASGFTGTARNGGHIAAELGVVRLIDLALATLATGAGNLVLAEHGAGFQGHNVKSC